MRDSLFLSDLLLKFEIGAMTTQRKRMAHHAQLPEARRQYYLLLWNKWEAQTVSQHHHHELSS
jgi:hypothetical protein